MNTHRLHRAAVPLLAVLLAVSSCAAPTFMVLDNIGNPQQAKAALVAVYDDPSMADLAVFDIGDGEAMSGIVVAGRRTDTGEATFLVFLMDLSTDDLSD